MDKFNEPGYVPEHLSQEDDTREPEVLMAEEFDAYCLDLYDAIKYGKRKERKRAARTLLALAVQMKDAVLELRDELHDVKEELHAFQFSEFPPDQPEDNGQSPWKTDFKLERATEAPGSSPLHLYTEEAGSRPSCVINEHAHGDDHHAHPDGNWAHVDNTVDAKLKEEAPPADTAD